MFWLALAGMGSSALGKQQGMEATVEGAETQAAIERMSREAQQRRFDRDVEYQKPFFEAGEKAVEPYAKAVKGEFDITQSPLYKMQKEMVMGELEGAPEGVRADALERLGAREGEMAKGRLLDLQKIGLGSAASAGQTALSFGSAFGRSLQQGQGALAQGALSGAQQQQNIWTGVMEDVSGYPAYQAQQQYLNRPPSMDAQATLPGGKESAFTNYELMY
jgi:hypothetical protein